MTGDKKPVGVKRWDIKASGYNWTPYPSESGLFVTFEDFDRMRREARAVLFKAYDATTDRNLAAEIRRFIAALGEE